MLPYECRYAKAFWFFERVSDERFSVASVVNAYLDRTFGSLERHVLVDVGSGFGSLAHLIQPRFRRRIAIEPNPFSARRLGDQYDLVQSEKFDLAKFGTPKNTVLLMSQMLYFYSLAERQELLAKVISSIDRQSVICLVVDTFAGEFGRFLRRWLGRFDLGEQLVQADEINEVIESIPGAENAFYEVKSSLVARNMFSFSRAVAIYFDVVEPAWQVTPQDYKDDLLQFEKSNCFRAENMLGVWFIRRGQHE